MDKITHKEARIPFIDPVLLALKSRRVVISLAFLLIAALVLKWAELEIIRTELTVLLVTSLLAIVAGLSWEDAARAGKDAGLQEPQNIATIIEEIVRAVIAAYVDAEAASLSSSEAVLADPVALKVLTPDEVNTLRALHAKIESAKRAAG